MAKTKSSEYYQMMITQHQALFDEFLTIHDRFKSEPAAAEADFHRVGQQVVDIVRDFDRRLCSAMGRGVYSAYSQKLSEKFWSLVRQDFDQIDLVGVRVKRG